jgi:phosphate transport system permease protein
MNAWKAAKIKRSVRQIRGEKIFKASLVLISLSILVIVVAFLFTLVIQSLPSIKALGFGFLFGKTWDPVHNIYGTYPFLL